jgi:hypothetical protein
VRADLLEKAVVDLVASTFSQQALLERAVRDAVQSSKADKKSLERRLKAVELELTKVASASERYTEAFESGSLKLELFAERLEELTKRRYALERDRAEIKAQVETGEILLVPDELLQEIRSEIGGILGGEITARKKEVMRLVTDHIDLSPERVATPVLRVPAVRKMDQGRLSCERRPRTRNSSSTPRRTNVRPKVDWVGC